MRPQELDRSIERGEDGEMKSVGLGLAAVAACLMGCVDVSVPGGGGCGPMGPEAGSGGEGGAPVHADHLASTGSTNVSSTGVGSSTSGSSSSSSSVSSSDASSSSTGGDFCPIPEQFCVPVGVVGGFQCGPDDVGKPCARCLPAPLINNGVCQIVLKEPMCCASP